MNRTISILMIIAAMLCGISTAFAENIAIYSTGDEPLEIDCDLAASQSATSIFLYDDGLTSNYNTSRNYTMTLNSQNGGYIALFFEEFNLAAGTLMSIRNEVTQEMLVSNATGTSLRNQTFMSTNGSITVIWNSGATTGAGFKARVFCGHACQRFETNIDVNGVSPTTVGTDTYYDICSGRQVQFHATNNFLQNGQHDYTQTDANLTYTWYIISSTPDTVTLTGQNPSYTFANGGGFYVLCNAKDQSECWNTNSNKKKVRISLHPTFTASFTPDSICPGTEITMTGEPHVEPWTGIQPPIIAGATFLPDGNNTCYSTSLHFNNFNEGQTVTSINDIERIYLNMEHSFLGDLSIMIECPNGQNCLLKAKSTSQLTANFIGWTNTGGINVSGSCEGGGTQLGLAHNDGSCNNNPGYGFPYYFYPDGTEGFGRTGTTVAVNRADYADSLHCPNDVQYTGILAFGEEHKYGSYENMSSLIGCPLNGTWTIYVCDHSPTDNGFIFEWGIYFDESLYPNNVWTFNTSFAQSDYSWSGVGMQSGMNGSANATAIVQNHDENNWAEIPYTFTATDNFGCAYDTTLLVHVKPAHHEDCCRTPFPTVTASELEPCGFSTTLVANAWGSYTGEWTYTGPGIATFADVNAPETSVTVNVEGDYVFTWHEYYMGNQSCTGDASVTVNFARPYNATLSSIPNSCRSGNMIILSAPDFGVLSCTPITNGADAGTALNEEARTFTPSLVAVPGTFTITNTIPDDDEHRCASPRVSSQTFTIYDELTVSNRVETYSTGYNPTVTISFNVNGVAQQNTPPPYYVRGRYTEYEGLAEEHGDTIPNRNDSQQAGQQCLQSQPYSSNVTSFSFSGHSPLEYVFYVTDEHGCSNVKIPGYYECACPNYAGTFVDYSPKIMCTGSVYWLEENHEEGHGHVAGSETLDYLDAYLSYIICTNTSDIAGSIVACKDATATSISLSDIYGGEYNRQYYLVAVAGYGQCEGVFTATGSNRCRSVSQAVPLMWKHTPEPTVTGEQTCGLVMQLQGSQLPAGMSGYWTARQEDNYNDNYSYTTIENTNNNMNNAVVLSSHYGTATYTWNVVNAECTGRASAEYTFLRIPQPEAGPDFTVCGTQALVNSAYQSIQDGTVQWSGAGVTFSPANSIQPEVTANTGGTYVLTLTERNGNECRGSDNVYITFVNIPSPTTTPSVDTVCGHVAELQVYNTNPYNEGRWTAYDMNWNVVPTVSYSDFDNPNGPNNNRYPHCLATVPIPDNQTEVEYIFKWTEPILDPRLPENVNCLGEAYKHIVFRKVPVVSVHQCGSSGNNVSVSGNSVELCGDVEASYGYTNFSWVCKNIEGSFSNPTGTSTTYTLDNSVTIDRYLDVDLYFTGTNGSCMAIDTMHVRFIQTADDSDSTSYAVCGLHYELTSENYNSNCSWIVDAKPNPNAQVAWTNTPHNHMVEDISVTDYGVYTFKLIESINGVILVNDVVTVEFMEIPSIYAGEDFDVCGLNFRLNAISSHVEGDNISGTWTSMSGGTASFADRTDPHTTAHYSAYGRATFRWTETNHPHIQTYNEGTCSAFDEVVVTFYEAPSAVISMNESDTAVCGLTFAYLRADDPGDGINGYWYEGNPSTMFGQDNQTVNSIITDVRVSSYGRHDFYWIEYTGPADNPRMCKDTAGPWHINFILPPTAQIAEEELTFCGYDGQMHADFNGVGTGRWSSNAHVNVVSFDDRNDPNTTVHTMVLNSGNTQNPYYELYWTVANTEYCIDKDTVRVVFAQIPSGEFTVIPPKCFGEPAIFTAYEDSLAVYNWDYGTGITDSFAYNAANGPYRAFVHWEDEMDTHVVELTTTNSWGCQSNNRSIVVEEPMLPEYNVQTYGDTCAKGNGAIEFIDNAGDFAFFWIDTTAGPHITNQGTGYPITSNNSYLSNIPAGTYTYRAEYQTYNRDYMEIYRQFFGTAQCTDFPEVEVGIVAGALDESPEITVVGELGPQSEVTLSVEGYASYYWSNGENSRVIHVGTPGYYNVTVADVNGCTAVSNQVQVGGSTTITEAPQISIVGMNNRNRNVVNWSAMSNENVRSYRIYRENNVADLFELVATVPVSEQTYWVDESSNPSTRAYRYKMTAVDGNGGESPMSNYHKTMHLTINRGIGTSWNLIWSHYEGFTFGTYRIFRGTSPSNMEMIEEIPSYQNSYTDYNAGTEEGLYYQVEIVRNIGTRLSLSSRSNIVTNEYVSNYTIVAAANNDDYGTVIGGGTYPKNTEITIYAIPNANCNFISWNDGNTENPRYVTVTNNAVYIANFEPLLVQYTINVLSANETMGTANGSGTYNNGEQVTISATANTGYRFTQWQDGNTANPRTITVTGDATYIASFEAGQQYTISVMSANETQGTASGGGTFYEGEQVTISAIPNEGFVFVNWQDNNTENPRTITVTGNATYIASFSDISMVTTYTITVISANENYGTVYGSGTYAEGTLISIYAIPNHGYQFFQWQDSNTDNPRQITVAENATYIATFNPSGAVEDNIAVELSVFPNPANDIINIVSSETISEIEIVNVMGQVVRRLEVNTDNAVCNVGDLTSGVYVVRIRTEQSDTSPRFSVRKFVKK